MKFRISTVVLGVLLVAGVGLLLYPTVSDWWNTLHATRAVASYEQKVQSLDSDRRDSMWADAVAYNESLVSRGSSGELTDAQREQYGSLLDVDGTGMMGYVEIPSIQVSLPIYHGTDDSVLQAGVGHIDWSSLPTGGESTHCVLSGHRGLPNARLFTNLDQLVDGDTFKIHVLGRTLTYEVDQILIVEPTDLSALTIEDGKDLCTLVTCTPYGVNSHRLLVRGHRVENASGSERVTSDATQVDATLIAPILAIPPLLVMLIWLWVPRTKKKKHGGADDAEE